MENISTPNTSSLANNLTARSAIGQMAMSIGSTEAWNHTYLFPNETCSEDDEDYSKESTLISESVTKWQNIPLCSSVSSIHASYPLKDGENDNDSISVGSFCYVNDSEIKSEDESYSVHSEDERKRPARDEFLNFLNTN